MSDFQKQTLKRFAVELLIVCAGVGLMYGMVKSKIVTYVVLALLVLVAVSGLLWVIITALCWDWKLRGLLNKDEYEAYHAWERHFGYNQDKYIPTKTEISIMLEEETMIDPKTLWSMFDKMTEGH